MIKEITERVLAKLNFDKMAKEIDAELRLDQDFGNELKKEIMHRLFGYNYSGGERLEAMIIKRLAEEFAKERGQEVLAQVDVKAVLNAIALNAAKNLNNELSR